MHVHVCVHTKLKDGILSECGFLLHVYIHDCTFIYMYIYNIIHVCICLYVCLKYVHVGVGVVYNVHNIMHNVRTCTFCISTCLINILLLCMQCSI